MGNEEDPKGGDSATPGWTPEALERLRKALKAEPRMKNAQPKPEKED